MARYASPLLKASALLCLCVALASADNGIDLGQVVDQINALIPPNIDPLGLGLFPSPTPEQCSDVVQAVCLGAKAAYVCDLLCKLAGCPGGTCTQINSGAKCMCENAPPSDEPTTQPPVSTVKPPCPCKDL